MVPHIPESITCFVTDAEIHEIQAISLLILWFFCEVVEFSWQNTDIH